MCPPHDKAGVFGGFRAGTSARGVEYTRVGPLPNHKKSAYDSPGARVSIGPALKCRTGMSIARGEGRTVSQFALVSYVPAPLSKFLDKLRLRLTPGAKPHAHVTILPPRPVFADLEEVKRRLAPLLRDVSPFRVQLGSIKVFPVSNVIYLSVEQGESDLRELNEALDRDDLRFETAFPYHPHITLAQEIPPESVESLLRLATKEWERYQGERGFLVDSLWLVQNVMQDVWLECGLFPLSAEAPVLG